jgi:hypothetical protein
MKELDLNKSVYDLTEAYPELTPILKEMGFLGMANPILRNTLGRVTTLFQGAQKQGIPLEKVVKRLEEAGFQIKR